MLMERAQFRVLYREFLLRAVDMELVSPGASVNTLLGQFGALLIFVGAALGYVALVSLGGAVPANFQLSMEHFLISTTMLVAGLFGVLSWDAAFPSKRDVFVLGPLPVRARTLFLAKAAANMAALACAIGAIHFLIGLLFPMTIAAHGALLAYWFTMFASGAFVFWCILGIQGVVAQALPRRYFLRISPLLQMGVFCALVCGYFLEPSYAAPIRWFLALFQELTGIRDASTIALAQRAWIGLVIASAATAVIYIASYFRTLRRIIEEPDILPGSGERNWLPRFGGAYRTAVGQFAIRTLIRSRQHRMILAFYLGLGCALLILFGKAPAAQQAAELRLFASSLVVVCLWIGGMRVVFAMPIDLRANWIFRITPGASSRECLEVRRQTLFVMGIAPAWIAWAIFFFWLWGWEATGHVVLLGLFVLLLGEVSHRTSENPIHLFVSSRETENSHGDRGDDAVVDGGIEDGRARACGFADLAPTFGGLRSADGWNRRGTEMERVGGSGG